MAYGSEFFQTPITSINPQGRLMDNMLKAAQVSETYASTRSQQAQAAASEKDTAEKYSTENVTLRKSKTKAEQNQVDWSLANEEKLGKNRAVTLQKSTNEAILGASDAHLESIAQNLSPLASAKSPKEAQVILDAAWQTNPDMMKELGVPKKYDPNFMHTAKYAVQAATANREQRQKEALAAQEQTYKLAQMSAGNQYSLQQIGAQGQQQRLGMNEESRLNLGDAGVYNARGYGPTGQPFEQPGGGYADTTKFLSTTVTAANQRLFDKERITQYSDQVTANMVSAGLWDDVMGKQVDLLSESERVLKNAVGAEVASYQSNINTQQAISAIVNGVPWLPASDSSVLNAYTQANAGRLAKSKEVGRYLSPQDYAPMGVVADIGNEAWDKLSPAEQKVLTNRKIKLMLGEQ